MAVTITDMPEELIHIIASYLDTKHLKNLYDTHRYLRNVITRAVRKCDVPDTKFLHSRFYRDISTNLAEVNMSGVWGLNKTCLLPGLKALKCIKTLDIGYTDIGIDDLSEIHKHCPSVIDITIDFKFSIKYNPVTATEYQNLLSHFENIHFVNRVGRQFDLAIRFLSTSHYNKITFSHIPVEDSLEDSLEIRRLMNTSFARLIFNQLRVICCSDIRKYRHISDPADHTSAILDVRNLAAISIEYNVSPYTSERCLINASPIFVEYLKKQFEEETSITIESWNKHRVCRYCSSIIAGNYSVMIAWNKETTQFDESFFLSLSKQLNMYTLVFRIMERS